MSPFPAEPLNTASSGSVAGKWSAPAQPSHTHGGTDAPECTTCAPVQPTPEPDTGGEVEALAKVIYGAASDAADAAWAEMVSLGLSVLYVNQARAVLDAGWVRPDDLTQRYAAYVAGCGWISPETLADRLAEARAEALREAADDLHGIESALDAMEDIILDAEDQPFRFTPTERRRIAIEDWLRNRAARTAPIQDAEEGFDG